MSCGRSRATSASMIGADQVRRAVQKKRTRGAEWAAREIVGLQAADEPCLFLNGLDTTLPENLKTIVHFLEPIGRVTLPIRNFADDAEWVLGTV